MFEFLLYSALFVLAWPVIAAIGAIFYVIGCAIWFLFHMIRFKIDEINQNAKIRNSKKKSPRA